MKIGQVHATFLLFICLSFFDVSSSLAQEKDSTLRYTKVQSGYLMVLRQGDNVIEQLERFAQKEHIPSANFTGMGFVNITFGFFDSAKKKFDPQHFKDVELASMQGTIAWQQGKPSIHLHGVVAGKDFKAYGGHILDGTVGTGSLEIMIIPHEKKFERVFEEDLGADVLHLKP
ncbi:PPC domain-containing DNA-binding protein [Olivibacter sp. XZL3]|uniref:PPC domain-containing DNA-binding protein n=1 Tax=Olivibacter sp. XZL3 TaxID=1735116 RepID=UPI00106679CB|nr:PPC domain-containing DNA-binding protein [Olivibacter sp. XZL3]